MQMCIHHRTVVYLYPGAGQVVVHREHAVCHSLLGMAFFSGELYAVGRFYSMSGLDSVEKYSLGRSCMHVVNKTATTHYPKGILREGT